MTPLCLRIAHDPDLRDESDDEEDDDEEFNSSGGNARPYMVTVEGHFCEPKVSTREGKRMLIPSCSPFNKFCNGGGNIRLRQLRREANIWPFYNEPNIDKSPWVRNYFNGMNSGEEIEWTVHFCIPAIMKIGGTTHAWPTCDPLRNKCNGGKLVEPLAKRYEWACFNEHMRKEVSFKGISFEDWVEVKFGEAKISPERMMKFRSKWLKRTF